MYILTFDIEDWFHILDFSDTKNEKQWMTFEKRIEYGLNFILDTLQTYDLSATFFCLGWVAETNPHLVKKITEYGFEIGSHSHSHMLLFESSPEKFAEDLRKSIIILEDISGKRVRAFRAPGFSLDENQKWAFEVLIQNNIEFDSSIFPSSRGHGGYKKFSYSKPCIINYNGSRIKEFPINIQAILGIKYVFSGGGYFRLIPYYVLRHLFKNSQYVMTYFHPRDFDEHQPVLKGLTAVRKFKSYYGLKNSRRKLRNIIKEFSFVDIDSADRIINWIEAPVFKI